MLEQYARSMGLHPGLRRCAIIKGWAALLTLRPPLTLFSCFNKEAVGGAGEVTHFHRCTSNRAVFAPETGEAKLLAIAFSKGSLFFLALALAVLFFRLLRAY
jgi:hypothetical protein